MNAFGTITGLFLFTLAGQALAEVTESADHGFTIVHRIESQAEPRAAYRLMTTKIHEWWDAAHSWSGDAANLYLEPHVGGCFCERLPNGGGVEHLRVIYLAPSSEIRFDGALGPLQALAVQGRMVWKIEGSDSGCAISFSYRVHGFRENGFEDLAPAVDRVIGEQLQRLADRVAEE